MSLRCFFCENIAGQGGISNVSDEERKHIFISLRKSDGDRIMLIDGKGTKAVAAIENQQIVIVSRETVQRIVPELHLFFSPPHNRNSTDSILDQSAELGIASITPIITEKSVSKPEKPAERWKKRLVEACKQSKNPFLPEIGDVLTLKEAMEKTKFQGFTSFFGCLAENTGEGIEIPKSAKLAWFVGPEGGFTQKEDELMKKSGFIPLRLPGWTLRTETACATGTAIIFLVLRPCTQEIPSDFPASNVSGNAL